MIITSARGESLVSHGYMNYRGMIGMLVFCGCVLDKPAAAGRTIPARRLRPANRRWLPLAFALDWNRPPRQIEQYLVFFYNHASQWRYEKTDCARVAVAAGRRLNFTGRLIISTCARNVWAGYPRRRSNLNPLSVKARRADKTGLSAAD